jgi:hypothetical protein
MITLPRTIEVWAYGRPTDLRKGYNGLWGVVKNELKRDPLGGGLFLFVNVKRTGCKVLLWDGNLYQLGGRATTVEQRGELRSRHAPAILEQMRAWMHAASARDHQPRRAIRRTLKPKNWEKLTVFVNDPLVWLDNNATERGLRGPVVGRRNHFGSKSVRGTEVAAVMYTLVESAKASSIDPMAYLIECATRAKRTPGTVLPPADFKAEFAQ